MERQKSFSSINTTKLLLLSFTIPSSLLLFFFLLSPLPLPPPPSPPITNGSQIPLTQWKDSIFVDKDSTLAHDAQTVAEEAQSPLTEWEDSTLGAKDSSLNHALLNMTSDTQILTEEAQSPLTEWKGSILSHAHHDMTNAAQSLAKDAVLNTTTGGYEDGVDLVGDRKSGGADVASCDVSLGRWVFDERYPLYESRSCPFVDEGFNCEANGRMDKDYMKWRWQPHQCSIPRFNPVEMLKMIRGKRLVFVGDSINRNQWESLLCLLRGAISDPSRLYEARGRRITKEKGNYNFKFKDYRCSVEYYVSHYLVHESQARVGRKRMKTLRIDTMDRSSSRWRGADIIIFNTAHWWSHYKTKSGVNYYQEGDQVHPRLDVSVAFRKALTTWAAWVDQHATRGKTQVFFRSSAPTHFSGGEWNSGGHCKESTSPLNNTYLRKNPEKNVILKEIVKQMRTPVTILNITNLSGLRIDGHPSIYGKNPGKGPASSVQDCSHWCLPGVPDTWNELLFYYLMQKRNSPSVNYTNI